MPEQLTSIVCTRASGIRLSSAGPDGRLGDLRVVVVGEDVDEQRHTVVGWAPPTDSVGGGRCPPYLCPPPPPGLPQEAAAGERRQAAAAGDAEELLHHPPGDRAAE